MAAPSRPRCGPASGSAPWWKSSRACRAAWTSPWPACSSSATAFRSASCRRRARDQARPPPLPPSDVSIKRPVFATVLSLIIVIFGLFAFQKLAVREYPNIDPPIITVNTTYKGAAAEIVESQITQIIEDAVSGIEGIRSMVSTSREESSTVSIEFLLTRNVDSAANDVRDKVSRVLNKLPEAADPPVMAKAETDSRPIMWLAVMSDSMTPMELTDYASRYLVDRFSVVPGVAQVTVGGERKYSMRIDLDRAALAARALTVQDVETAIRRQNVDLPAGRIESRMREMSVKTDSSLSTPEQFRALVVKQTDGYLIRLGEVAKIELAPENDRSDMLIDGKPTIGLGVYRQSVANALEISEGVRAELAKVKDSLPPGMQMKLRYDSSEFISQSIFEVYHATGIALALVIGVIFIFLRSWRATVIPAVAIPVSIIGSFIILGAFGYSLNVLTLLAMVLAIGLVVDDAIVVLENIHRRIEEGEPPLVASLRGAQQIGFAVIATTVVLIAVFVPISLLEGSTGRLFREFGIAMAAAVLFSGFVALTLTPMLCSKLLHSASDEGILYRITEPVFTGMQNGYKWLLAKSLDAPIVTLAIGVAAVASISLLFGAVREEFAPLEDRGTFFVQVQGPEGTSLEYTRRYAQEIERRMKTTDKTGVIDGVMTVLAPGFNRPGPVNEAFVTANLKHWHDRQVKQQDLTKEIFPQVLGVPGVNAFVINPPSLGQPAFQAPIQFVIGGPSYEQLDEWADRVIQKARENDKLLNVRKNYQPTRPELRVSIDRLKAADLGVSLETIGRTLETMLGQRLVTTFDRDGKQFNVIVRGRAADRSTPSDLSNIYVRSETTRTLIPLSNLVKLQERAIARELNRVDRMRTITIQASLAPGYTLGEGLTYMDGVAAAELPPEARVSYRGQSREFRESSAALYVTLALAMVVVFLALAAQFESWIHPFVIMLGSAPLAILGALASLWLTGTTLNVFSKIGLVMLVGLVAKNAILIVEFANQLRDTGLKVREAVLEAAATRLRPILMTSIATVFGAWPLANASGAGAESRQALGVVIIGGMTIATLLGLFIVPVLYRLVAGFTKPAGYIARKLSEMQEEHPIGHGHEHGHGHGGAHGHQGAAAE
jgi:multidrug efflux pump